MKKSLLFILFIIFTLGLQAQKDTVNVSPYQVQKSALADAANASITIYPVPIRENYFTIRSEKEITSVKVTNIIGQDIFKVKCNNPETLTKINLDNPKRGMYLVTIVLDDGARVVKKIMIEQAE
ncbi:MAG: T9SS type A sorting domain-containing protein [Bacteroidia bacterium]|nr:T9SS type A sorting domain-containing protein [Bacteroidia bacterium]